MCTRNERLIAAARNKASNRAPDFEVVEEKRFLCYEKQKN
jgi:hypothetical protein